ncbi:MAG TPA: Mu transposase C-terminal domain-containing protein [Pyrinomonadaceae bacterium]|jgi:putative transposase
MSAPLTENASALLRPDEYTEEQLEKFAINYQLISLIKNGVGPQEALMRLGIKNTPRWARGLYRRFKEHGANALLDRRTCRKTKVTVLNGEVKKLILMWWAGRRAAGGTAIARKVKEECQKRGLKPPSESSVKQYIAKIPKPLKAFRKGKIGIREWEQEMCPVVLTENTNYSNERWQTDHTPLKIWVRIKVGDTWVPCQSYLTAYMDAHSRSIPSFELSAKHPDSWTTSLLMMKAVLPKEDRLWKNRGLPRIVQPDRGSDFMSDTVLTAFGHLGIFRDPDAPYYPNGKGKLERWFETIDDGCFRMLPGHKEDIGRTIGAATKHVHVLLTVPQLRKEIERWIIEDYHQREHSETGRKPIELWEETVRLRPPENEDDLYLFLLKSDVERTVQNIGIRFKHPYSKRKKGNCYWVPELAYHVKRRVRLRYNPEDSESVMVYCAATGRRLCEAWLMGQPNSRYKIADVKRCRSEFKRDMVERIKEYRREVEEEDRQNAQQAEWAEARRLAAEEMEIESDFDAFEDTDREVLEALLEQFKRQDRGEL